MAQHILVIEDEISYHDTLRDLLSDVAATIEYATNPRDAAEYLRRRRYDLVLLDLSMDIADRRNRDNEPIQAHLAGHPEGASYIIVSEAARRQEVDTSIVHRGARRVFIKTEMEPSDLLKAIVDALMDSRQARHVLIESSRRRLMADLRVEHAVMSTLGIEDGAAGLYRYMDALFGDVAPVARHLDRAQLSVREMHAFGLFWSRDRATAVAYVGSLGSIPEEGAHAALIEWLGYAPLGQPFRSTTVAGARQMCWDMPELPPDDFELPRIA